MFKRSIFVLLALSSCRGEQVRKDITLLVSKINGCQENSIAALYGVPEEPQIDQALLASIKAPNQLATKDKRAVLSLSGYDDPLHPSMFCLFWDIDLDGQADFLSCRIVDAKSQTLRAYPFLYATGLKMDQSGKMYKANFFLDLDADGDICDAEFMLYDETTSLYGPEP